MRIARYLEAYLAQRKTTVAAIRSGSGIARKPQSGMLIPILYVNIML